ncbi:MAG: class I SAM-dependent methyltransferase [Oscillospiraceae bacterium]|nr:class I SAM-dependent methyltransferase [Oscillospiraceae bacterium]
MYDRDETGAEDVDFALYLIGLRPRRVLDVACGSGRFLVPLARAGHTAEGFDFDPAMLERIPLRAGDTGGWSARRTLSGTSGAAGSTWSCWRRTCCSTSSPTP